MKVFALDNASSTAIHEDYDIEYDEGITTSDETIKPSKTSKIRCSRHAELAFLDR